MESILKKKEMQIKNKSIQIKILMIVIIKKIENFKAS